MGTPRQSNFDRLNGDAAIKNATINLAANRQQDCSTSIDGGGWVLVRHAGPSGWGPWNDNLAGTAFKGPVGGPTSNHPWTVPWSSTPSKFLFSFADCSEWLVATEEAVRGRYYAGSPRVISSSSRHQHHYAAKWYNRKDHKEDPWVSVGDHPDGVVYGENGWPASKCHYHGKDNCLTQM